jgi:hypothetical protein
MSQLDFIKAVITQWSQSECPKLEEEAASVNEENIEAGTANQKRRRTLKTCLDALMPTISPKSLRARKQQLAIPILGLIAYFVRDGCHQFAKLVMFISV